MVVPVRMIVRMRTILLYMIPKIIDAFSDFFFRCSAIYIKAYIAGGEIYFYIFPALFFQVFMNGQCTVCAIHSIYLPLNLFHILNLSCCKFCCKFTKLPAGQYCGKRNILTTRLLINVKFAYG